MNRDLTTGKPEKVLWQFCLPLFCSIIFQQLYNIADSLVAGRFIGEQALAAVGNSYEVTLIFIAFGFGCNIGWSVVLSAMFGAGKYKELKSAVSTAMISMNFTCTSTAGSISGWITACICSSRTRYSSSRLFPCTAFPASRS